MPLTVCKFGGSSLATGERVLAARALIKADAARGVAVVSAPGKRFEGDEKVTDLLLRFSRSREAEVWREIEARYLEIAGRAGYDIRAGLDEARERIIEGAGEAFAMSRGEYLLARVFASALGFAFVDAAECVCFGLNGLDEARTFERMRAVISERGRCVIPGFYGARADGRICVFPRGGSDITGALAARAVNADVYENWTDVDGVYDKDPARNPGARKLNYISYSDMLTLCESGACVIHPDSLYPVMRGGIPVHVRNTFNPLKPGTWIRPAQRSMVST